jgi:hypothetical protein
MACSHIFTYFGCVTFYPLPTEGSRKFYCQLRWDKLIQSLTNCPVWLIYRRILMHLTQPWLNNGRERGETDKLLVKLCSKCWLSPFCSAQLWKSHSNWTVNCTTHFKSAQSIFTIHWLLTKCQMMMLSQTPTADKMSDDVESDADCWQNVSTEDEGF